MNVEAALDEVHRSLAGPDWPRADAPLARAKMLAAECTDEDLIRHVQQAAADFTMLTRLDEILLTSGDELGKSYFDYARLEAGYRDAFASYGIDEIGQTDRAAELIRKSTICTHLTNALAELYNRSPNPTPDVLRLLQATDTDRWRKDFISRLIVINPKELEAIAVDAQIIEQPPGNIMLLGAQLMGARSYGRGNRPVSPCTSTFSWRLLDQPVAGDGAGLVKSDERGSADILSRRRRRTTPKWIGQSFAGSAIAWAWTICRGRTGATSGGRIVAEFHPQ